MYSMSHCGQATQVCDVCCSGAPASSQMIWDASAFKLIIVADQMVVIIRGQYLAHNRASRIAHENRGHSGRDRSTL